MDTIEVSCSVDSEESDMDPPTETPVKYKVQLIGKNTAAKNKLLTDGSYFYLKKISKKSRVKRLQGIKGPHVFIQCLSSPVTRWVALKGDPDYTIIDSEY